MTPAFPPSSSVTFFLPAFCFRAQPTFALPVKVNILRRSSDTNFSATSFPSGNTLKAPAVRPALATTSASSNEESGVCGAGFKVIVQPAAIAGATLCATRFSGKLNGVIARIGPTGNRRTIPARPAVELCQSSGSHSPPMRVASSAATANVKMALSTSTRAVLIGFPASRHITCENSSCRARIPSEIALSIRLRS